MCPYLLHKNKGESFVSVDSDGPQRETDLSGSYFVKAVISLLILLSFCYLYLILYYLLYLYIWDFPALSYLNEARSPSQYLSVTLIFFVPSKLSNLPCKVPLAKCSVSESFFYLSNV